MIETTFPAYEGDQPYFFVSYSHADAEIVYSEMRWIREAGYNLWYDDGIHIGSVWRRVLAADACAAAGLDLIALPADITSKIDSMVPSRWSRSNPIDLAGGETRDTVTDCPN